MWRLHSLDNNNDYEKDLNSTATTHIGDYLCKRNVILFIQIILGNDKLGN